MMKKLSILLVILCLLLPAAAMAANPTVEIGDVELPNGYYMASDTNVPVAEKPDGGYAYLKDGVLELSNYRITSSAVSTLTVTDGALKINLVGYNSLSNAYFDEGYGIWLRQNASLTVGGTGELFIGASYCVYGPGSKGVQINGGKLTIRAQQTGFYLRNDLLISSGEMSIISKVRGIEADMITITGGKITIDSHTFCIHTPSLRISGADTVLDLTSSPDFFGLLDVYQQPIIESPLKILEPEGGYLNSWTILNTDGTIAHHAHIANPNPPTPAPAVPQTGDGSVLTLWLALAVLAMTGMVLLRKRAYR